MKITGLKVLSVRQWKADSTFVAADGRTIGVPANHKIILTDENGDIVNATIITSVPLNLTVGKPVDLTLVGAVQKNQFGWTVKATI